jgi:hypothetical protein
LYSTKGGGVSNWDISLNGVGYLVVPGSYRSFLAGSSDAVDRLTRQTVQDFRTGLGGPRDGGLFGVDGLGAWPAPWPVGSAGIGPAPKKQTASGSVGSGNPKLTANSDAWLYVAAGTNLHRWSGSGSPASRATLPATIVDFVRRGDALFCAYDTAADVSRFVDATTTQTLSVLGAGYKAGRLGVSGDILVTSQAGNRSTIDVWNSSLTVSTNYKLQGEVSRMVPWDRGLLIATNQGIYLLSGVSYGGFSLDAWGSVSGGAQADDDYAWMVVHQGRLLAWFSGQVMGYDRVAGVWRPLGLAGQSSSGATATGGWLTVAAVPPAGGGEQLWAFDGEGWWLLDAPGSYPAGAPGGRLASFSSGSGTLAYYELDELLTGTKLRSPFVVETALLDGGLPDRAKRWSRVGVELARPDGQPVGSWSYGLDWSSDAGTTWQAAGSATVTDEVTSLSFPISVEATWLRLRLTGTQLTGLPPFVMALWAEHDEPTLTSLGGRRWTFQIHAHDGGIDRAGALDPRTGQQIRAALWNLAESGASIPFRDVDYAATSAETTVRLIDLRERWTQTADQPSLGADTVLDVTLAETE